VNLCKKNKKIQQAVELKRENLERPKI